MGATVKALDRGVPVCVVPFARDQAEVARRVQVARCGTRPASGEAHCRKITGKSAHGDDDDGGARRVAAGFTATGGVTRGADLIEQQLLGQATDNVA